MALDGVGQLQRQKDQRLGISRDTLHLGCVGFKIARRNALADAV